MADTHIDAYGRVIVDAHRTAAPTLERRDTQFRMVSRGTMRGSVNAPATGTQPMGGRRN